MSATSRFLLFAAAGLLLSGAAWAQTEEGPTEEALRAAIDTVRGIDRNALNSDEKEALSKRLNGAWQVLLEAPEKARPLIREALEKEKDDDFFLIDLTYLYLTLDPEDTNFEPPIRWLLRADPNAYPETYFDIASSMAAMGCGECLPVCAKMLQLKTLDGYIRQHSLPVDIRLGLNFTLLPYDAEIFPLLEEALQSKEAHVRANAAYLSGYALPPVIPTALLRMAVEDPDARVRREALISTAVLEPLAAVRIADASLRKRRKLDAEDLSNIIDALQIASSPEAKVLLEDLSQNGGEAEKTKARQALAHFPRYAALGRLPEDASPRGRLLRSVVVPALKKTLNTSRFEHQADPRAMALCLKQEDLGLLKSARNAVLKRLSDECIYEFHTLHAAAILLNR